MEVILEFVARYDVLPTAVIVVGGYVVFMSLKKEIRDASMRFDRHLDAEKRDVTKK